MKKNFLEGLILNRPFLYLNKIMGDKNNVIAEKYIAAKNVGLEWIMARLPNTDVKLYIEAAVIIYIEPFSFKIAFIGPRIPKWRVSIFKI